jgi:hypothetical protein
MEGCYGEWARLTGRAQGRMGFARREGLEVDTLVGEHARAQGTGGKRRPGRKQRFAVAAWITKKFVPAQQQDIERLKEHGVRLLWCAHA